MDIVPVTTPDQLAEIRQLFAEYFEWIRTDLHIGMGYQGVQAELAALPGYFTPPQGRLFLAVNAARSAGCVALRPMKDERVGELKRMYVRPEYRGQGLGRLLGQRIIDEARTIGYHTLRLDTADSLATARRLYTSLGFHERDAYYEVPPDVLRWTIFMEMSLT